MKVNHQLIILVAAFGLTHCSSEDEPSVTQQLEKIETSYVAGATKIEGFTGSIKVESIASQSFINAIANEVESEIDALMANRNNGRTAAVGDYDIGEPASPTSSCSGEKIQIYMDCEDDGPETNVNGSISGNIGGYDGYGPWYIDSNWNLRMFFCRIDGLTYASIASYPKPHAVLKLGPLNPPGTTRIFRHFDNQDRNNKNSHVGNISPNVSGSNTDLTFHVFPANASEINYNGRRYFISDTAPNVFNVLKYHTDDEDNRNANYFRINDGGNTSNSGVTFISGAGNTDITVVQVN